jgi:rRNA maturation endonuclease Nob1
MADTVMHNEPRVPTTLEMDGLISEKDIENRYKIMEQCRACAKWTLQDTQAESKKPCQYCGENNFDPTSGTSLRTYNPLLKRKPKG